MKNEIIKGQVIDYTHDGKGIIKYDGYPIFVKDTILNENIELKIIKDKKKYGFGKVENILTKSDNRVEPPCIYYQQCGGCQLQVMNYEEQVSFKKRKIVNAFNKQKIALDYIDFIENDQPFNYRNKLSIPLAKNNSIYAGLYRENSNDIIKIESCLIQEDSINKIMQDIVKMLNRENINIYNKFKHKGYLRQIIIRKASNTNEILVGFVINNNQYKGELDYIIDELVSDNKDVKTVLINFNNKNTNVILGDNSVIIYGSGYIIDKVDGFMFQISLNSFYQINTRQMSKLYNKAILMADLKSTDLVLDAYCGVGTISSYISKQASKVIGVDIIKDAINDAKMNKQLNDIDNIDYLCMDVNEYIKNNANNFDCIFIDPPRKGCSKEFLDEIISTSIKKIVYISCDVGTQARDIRYLLDNGYLINGVSAVDMFSQTHHVENIVVMSLSE